MYDQLGAVGTAPVEQPSRFAFPCILNARFYPSHQVGTPCTPFAASLVQEAGPRKLGFATDVRVGRMPSLFVRPDDPLLSSGSVIQKASWMRGTRSLRMDVSENLCG